MHHCLTVTEILYSIIELSHCNDDSLFRDTRSVFGLVLTCKSFLEPALDVLWKEQSDLSDLLRCLPADSWKEARDDDSRRKIVSFPSLYSVDQTLMSSRSHSFVSLSPTIGSGSTIMQGVSES